MFNKSQPSQLTVTLDRADGVYRPGEVIGITVEVQPAKDLKVRGGRVRLSGTEHYQVCSLVLSTDSDGKSTQRYSYEWWSDGFFAEDEAFLSDTTLPADVPQRYTFQARVPAGAAPTSTGEILRVEWLVEVKVDRPLAGDLNAEAVVRVPALASGGAAPAPPTAYGVSDEPQEAELALVLPGLEAVAGQPVNGELRILPRKDFSAAVRLELVRSENVPVNQGQSKEKSYVVKLAGSTKFKAGQPQVIPFQAPLPPDAPPSLQMPHGTLTWTVKGILARRLRRDTRIQQAITVFSETAA